MNTSVKVIRVMHTPNGKSVWRFCTTSDGAYIAIKNNWTEVKSFKSWKQLLFQANRWLTYTNNEGEATFVAGWPKKAKATTTASDSDPVVAREEDVAVVM